MVESYCQKKLSCPNLLWKQITNIQLFTDFFLQSRKVMRQKWNVKLLHWLVRLWPCVKDRTLSQSWRQRALENDTSTWRRFTDSRQKCLTDTHRVQQHTVNNYFNLFNGRLEAHQHIIVCLFVCLVFNGTFSTNRLYCAITVGQYIT